MVFFFIWSSSWGWVWGKEEEEDDTKLFLFFWRARVDIKPHFISEKKKRNWVLKMWEIRYHQVFLITLEKGWIFIFRVSANHVKIECLMKNIQQSLSYICRSSYLILILDELHVLITLQDKFAHINFLLISSLFKKKKQLILFIKDPITITLFQINLKLNQLYL